MQMTENSTEIRDAYAASLGDRIRECRSGISRDEFARQLDMHVNTVGKFERGLTVPDAYSLLRMAEIGKCSPEWLLTGQMNTLSAPLHTRAVERGDFLFVPHFDVTLSAGNGLFTAVEQVIAMRPFDIKYIRQDLDIHHNDLVLVSIEGRSMQPYLKSKDTVMLDLQATDVRAEGIHGIRMDGALLVKRVQRFPKGVLHVSSANEEFAPFEIPASDEGRDFKILGRVRWGGITFD